jgi:dipeptidyl aminopeptidase/acylaminoacyl peptidase
MPPVVRLAAAFLTLATLAVANSPAPVSVKDLFRDHDFLRMALSPDGRWLASLFSHEIEKDIDFHGLAVMNVDTGEIQVLQRAKDVTTRSMEWVGDGRLMATMRNKRWQSSRYTFEIETKTVKELVSPDVYASLGFTHMIHPLGDAPDEILVGSVQTGMRDFDRAIRNEGYESQGGIYRLNVVTGERKLVAPDPGLTLEWFADPAGKLRIAYGLDKNAFRANGRPKQTRVAPPRVMFWLDDQGTPVPVEGLMMDEAERFSPLGFEAGGKRFLFAGRQGQDLAAIWAWNPETRTVEGPVLAHERVDLQHALINPHDRSVAGILVHHELGRIEWLDPRLKRLQQSVDAALPGFSNRFMNWSHDYQRVLVRSIAADEPGRYHLLDLKRGTLAEVYRSAPWLKGVALGRAEAVEIPARDGLRLPGFLTLPPGATRDRPLPFVLLVHGGPWNIRDYPFFDPEVQFYATRGYAVLQVNYRGSGGYGRRHVELARRQFAGTMQQDLDDAVDWAIAQGIADPAKLILAGSSYGGYATLIGVAQQPNRFRAGVPMFPVTDLRRQIAHYEKTADLELASGYAYELWKEWVGDPERDRAVLDANSPLNLLARIRAPLFIVYGENDPRIDFNQPADLVRGLRALKRKFVRVAPHREGHGLSEEKSRFQVYVELEKFLREHVPVN